MRQIIEEDWPLFCQLHQEPTVIELVFDEPPLDDIKVRFNSRLPKWTVAAEHWLCLVIIDKETGMPVGVTGFQIDENDRSRAEVGYLLITRTPMAKDMEQSHCRSWFNSLLMS